MEIVGSLKNYDWGKLGLESEVAKLAQCNSQEFSPEIQTPFSELWMGDHPSGSSTLKATGESLAALLQKNKLLIGNHQKLPFLFKVLSIRKALSIQVHPNKKEAERLHASQPDLYKDPNHKPELAIALTPFQALCGFRLCSEIYSLCKKFHPLEKLLGKGRVNALQKGGAEAIKECYSTLMTCTPKDIEKCVEGILKECDQELKSLDLDSIFHKLNNDFRNDVGLLSLFFLNVLRLKPGDAIFLPANEPHAYLEGDCIECMACSDNVVRAGLTPKHKDVPTLLNMLNYEPEPVERKLFQPVRVDEYVELFAPEIDDFAVKKIRIPMSVEKYKLPNHGFGAILLVLHGKCCLQAGDLPVVRVGRGSIIFIPGNCGEAIDLNFSTETSEDFVAYQAMYNSF